MFKTIKKRDGRIVKFDSAKITSAIARAGKATGEFGQDEAKRLAHNVLSLDHDSLHGGIPEVEEIQDLVERVLIDSPFHKSAKAYIRYRDQHAQVRSLSDAANVDLVERYLFQQDWRVTENSNMRLPLQGLNNFISSHVSSEHWMNRIYPPTARPAGEVPFTSVTWMSFWPGKVIPFKTKTLGTAASEGRSCVGFVSKRESL